MELLGLALIWPLLLLLVGFVFISSANAAGLLTFFVFLFFLVMILGVRTVLQPVQGSASNADQLDQIRRAAAAFSIALLLPIFVKYMLDVYPGNLPTMILGLVIGFGALVWGMFAKGNRVITVANCIGGALTIIYLYFELWTLGQLAQMIATAFGLAVAILISVIKFRDKLA